MKQKLLETILGIPSEQIVPFVVPTLIEEFDFFNQIGLQKWDVTTLQNHFGFDERVCKTTLAYLERDGYIKKLNKQIELTEDAKQFLVKEKHNLTPYATLMHNVYPSKMRGSISHALRTGTPAKWEEQSWEDSMRSGSIAKRFSEGLMARASVIVPAFVKAIEPLTKNKQQLLDIGGSLGDYSEQIMTVYPQLDATVYELPNVANETRKHLQDMKSSVSVIEGDMFAQDLPKTFDMHLYSNVLHDWREDEVKLLLQKSYESLNEKGRVLIHDMHVSKNSSEYVLNHSLYLSIFTNGQCYTYDAMKNLLVETGFTDVGITDTIGGFSVIYAQK